MWMWLTGEADAITDSKDRYECCSKLSNLPEHLLVEVLCRLPAKSLLRSKLVCKLWCYLITYVCVPKLFVSASIYGLVYHVSQPFCLEGSPYLQYARYLRKLKFQFMPDFMGACFKKVQRKDIGWPFYSSNKYFLDCCNGLFLFSSASRPQYYVFNPATNQVVELPLYSQHKGVGYAALAFHPLESPNGYRVVHFNQWEGFPASEPVTIDVYSSETGNWLTHPIPLETAVKVAKWTRRCVYLNGVMYRLSHSKHLLWFKLDQHSARVIELPEGEKTNIEGYIGVSKGCLHYSNNDGSTLFVWVLVEDVSCLWILKHTIYIHDLVTKEILAESHSMIHRSSWFNLYALDVVSGALYIGFPRRVFRYDIDQQALELVYSVYSNQEIISGSSLMFPYIPCLVILRDCKQVDHLSRVDGFRKRILNLKRLMEAHC